MGAAHTPVVGSTFPAIFARKIRVGELYFGTDGCSRARSLGRDVGISAGIGKSVVSPPSGSPRSIFLSKS